ncbi:hypothetical protein D3C76_1640310 [compost metagenome]
MNHGVGIELIERTVDFHLRHIEAAGLQLGQGMAGGILLAAQLAGQATVETQTQLCQMSAEHFGLANTRRREDVVVVCAEGSLAMSYQIDAAHVRFAPVR